MAHMMKHTKASCGHMFAHFDRKAEHISNENLDRTRTHLNYNLATHQQMNQGEFVRQRCSEVRCQNRKDVNVMVSWIITAPKDLPEQEQRAFFKASYDFCKERYGEENVVSAYVHMDEVTPHMHFAFVPIVEDKKKSGYKVSAKECVNRSDLQTFHNDLESYLEQSLGHRVNILNEATKEGNKSIEELKKGTAAAELRAIKNQIKAFKGVLITADEINKIQPQKTLTGQIKGVSIEEIENLKQTALRGILAEKKVIQLEKENAHLKTQIPGIKDKLKYAELKSLNALIEQNPQLKQLIKQSAVNKKNISKER